MRNWKVLPVLLLLGHLFFGSSDFLKPTEARAGAEKMYVGSEQCMECHEDQYRSYKNNSKKAHSSRSIKVMSKGLTASEINGCYECHATGFGKPGGFRSEAETPHLMDAGCEVCHGPGSLHAETGDPRDIKGKLAAKDCTACHNSERIQSFRFKPMIYGGGH
jgi:hypothetical protein